MYPSVTLDLAWPTRALMVGNETPRSSAVELNECRRPCDEIPGTSAPAMPFSQRVSPVWFLWFVVIAGKTYLEFDLDAAVFRTVIAAEPTGRMLLPPFVFPNRSAIPTASTSVF